MSQAISSEVLARKPKKRVEWVMKRLKDELSAPGTNRDVIYDVLTRKEGRAFATELPGTDAQRVYAATMQTLSAFTTRQQRVLQSASFVLRQLHDQEQERLAGLLSPPVVREVPKPVKTVASVGTPPGPPPPKAANANRNAGKDLNATSKREVTSLTQSLQSDLELLRGAVSTAKEASARREEAVTKPRRRRGRRSASDGSEDGTTDLFDFSLVSPPRGESKKESSEKGDKVVEVVEVIEIAAPSSSSTGQVPQQRPKEKDAKEEEFQKGSLVFYRKPPETKPEQVTLVKVHYEDDPPYYTIRLSDGREKQTIRDYLAKNSEDFQAVPDPPSSSATASGSKAASDAQDATEPAKEPEKAEDSLDLEESLKKSLEAALKKDKEKQDEIKAPVPAKADAVEDFLAPDEFDLNSPGCSPPPASPNLLLQSPGCTPPGTPELKQSPGCSPPVASPDVLETKAVTEDSLAEAPVASKLAMEDSEPIDKAESSTLDKTKEGSEEPKLANDNVEKSDEKKASEDAIPEQSEQAQSENSTQVPVNPEAISAHDSNQQEQHDASKEEVTRTNEALPEERAQVPHIDHEDIANDASCSATSLQAGKSGEDENQPKEAVRSQEGQDEKQPKEAVRSQGKQDENQPKEAVRSQDIFSRRQVPEIYKKKKRKEDRDSTTRVRRHEETSRKHGRRRDKQDKPVKAKRREETSRKHRSKDVTHRDSEGRKRRRRRDTEDEEEEEQERDRSPSRKRELLPEAAVPQTSRSPFDAKHRSSTSSKLKRSSDACVFSAGSNQASAVAPPPPPQRSTPLLRDSRETKKRVLSSSSMRPVRLRPSSGVGCTSRSRSREALRTRRQSAKTSVQPSLAAANPSIKLQSTHTSPESSQWSPEKRKKEILRRQLEQKTREVQSLRNKLLSKRLEQASMTNKVVSIQATTPNTIAKLSRSTSVPAQASGSHNTSTFNPPPPLKQALGGSTSSIIAGLESREALATMQESVPLAESEPLVDVRAPAPSFARSHANTTVVEVEVRDDQPVQRRAKAPEVCWDLRRNISSGQNSKVHLVPHESKLQLDEKKKKLQELMQKQRSLAVSKVAHAESQAPAVIDLS